MWKWTDGNNIKCIILDADSLKQDFMKFDFSSIKDDIAAYRVIKSGVMQIGEAVEEENGVIKYFDNSELLKYVLRKHNIESTMLIVVSDDITFINEFINLRIGTVYTSNLNKSELKSIPDFCCRTVDEFANLFNGMLRGYSAEQLIASGVGNNTRLIKCNVELPSGKEFQIVSGGRYYPTNKEFYPQDLLSNALLKFKKEHSNLIDRYYSNAILAVYKHLQSVDCITFVPQKPKDIAQQKFDRFHSLSLDSLKKSIRVEDLFECKKDFVQKENNTVQRVEVVKKAFELKRTADINNKHIVILDDLFATGSTASALAELLYEGSEEAGKASLVTVITLAINQPIYNPFMNYKYLKCPKCGGDMKVWLTLENQGAIFGCSTYPECKETVTVVDGLKKIIENNKFEISEIDDFEDLY